MSAYIKHLARAIVAFCICGSLSLVIGLDSVQTLGIACSGAIVSLIIA
jgi:hypothetical protein